MHGIHYKPGMILAGFALSEKLDGIRIESRAGRPWSKQGHALRLPGRIRDALPHLPDLDGELYAGPGCRIRLSALAQSLAPAESSWPADVALYIFDSALPLPYTLPEGVRLVPAFGHAEDTADALSLASSIISAGGEGAMARCPNLPWQSGRTSGLVKIKRAALALVSQG